ncbi:SWI/SNF subfamily A-like protein [Euroglyphus maynei]|uniref:SWI/SNF subfamily A-like protein n=1 Tax=Euroglyphus maynei TaxID=6958 RepID=A0A1Y3AUK1_EURMA|nr:SWI/SNF subfamily A-like protein [Euroglyphus maynei]
MQKLIDEKRKKAMELCKRRMEMKRQMNQQPQPIDMNRNTSSKYFRTEHEKINSNQIVSSVKNTQQNFFTQLNDRNNSAKTVESIAPTTSSSSSSSVPANPAKKTAKISVKLLDKSRFLVELAYEEEIIKKFKRYETRQYDPVKKTWSFSLKEFSQFMTDMKELNRKNLTIVFEKSLSEALIKTLIENQNMRKIPIELTERLESDFYDKLYPYQREGIKFGIQRDGKCLIADDMGLGKTIQAIGLAKWFRDDWPLIIICPSSLRFQWKEKIMEYFPDINESDIFVATDTKKLFPRVSITITSYDIMVRMKDRLTIETNRFYRMIIMDESHYIKSDDSKRTNIATQVARSCSRIILLTGTPALSRPIELFPQINLIAPDLFPSRHSFGLRYCKAKQYTFQKNGRPISIWNYKGADNLDELRIILENTIMIRRLKKDVLNELPTKKREMFSLLMDQMTNEQITELNLYMAMMKKSKKYNDRTTVTFKWFQKSAEIKIPAVTAYLEDILKPRDVKIICFCHHKAMMDGVDIMLRKNLINFIRIDGSTAPKDRQEACDTFQKDSNFRVALLSLTACATGLNLTAASMVIFTELYWTPGVLAQAEDRAHRIGQSNNVRVIYLVAKRTIDEMMWPVLSKKLEILQKAGLSRDTYADTYNPLENNDNEQSLLTDFFNHLDQSQSFGQTLASLSTTKQPTIQFEKI